MRAGAGRRVRSRLNRLDKVPISTRRGADLRAAFTRSSEGGSLSRRLDGSLSSGVCGIGHNAFPAGTPIETDEGQQPIETITLGDPVLGQDPETGEQGLFAVAALTNHPTNELLRITLAVEPGSEPTLDTTDYTPDNDDQQSHTDPDPDDPADADPTVLETTPDHPVYVEGAGWVWAENLALGDRLRLKDGGVARVLALERVELAAPVVVYNFTIEGPHTYFAGDAAVLVHNEPGVRCIPVKGGNPWRDAQGRFAKTPDFDAEMGVFTAPDVSRELPEQIVDRPIAELDPVTGKPIPLPSRLERRGGVWYPEEPRWGQGEFSNDVGWPPSIYNEEFQRIDLETAVDRLWLSGEYPSEMLVFRKLPSIQEPRWRMRAYERGSGGKIHFKDQLPAGYNPDNYYFGDYANLPDDKIIVLNNRTYTVANLVPLDEDIVIPIYWASRQEIEGLSYQASAIDQGRRIIAKDPTKAPQPEIVVPSLR